MQHLGGGVGRPIRAGGLVYALPPVVLFVVVQRHIVAGLTAGAVKG